MIHSLMEDSGGCYGINKKGQLFNLRSSGAVHGLIGSFLEEIFVNQVLSMAEQGQGL